MYGTIVGIIIMVSASPAKKQKIVTNDDKLSSNNNNDDGSYLDDNLKMFRGSIKELYEIIDEIVELSSSSENNDEKKQQQLQSCIMEKGIYAMLKCKQSQRNLCLFYEKDKKKSVTEAMSSVEQANLAYQNVLYQKQHLQKQIRSIQNSRETKQKNNALLTMAQQEKTINKSPNNNNDNNNDDEAIVDQFLAPTKNKDDESSSKDDNTNYSHLDPKQYEYTQQKLKEEIQHRMSCVKQLQSSRIELQKVTKEYQEISAFISGLPKHARTLQQKFVNPLEQYFNVSSYVHDRQERLEQAQQLSAPLYTIFTQLSTHLQVQNQDDDNSPFKGITVTIHKKTDDQESPSTDWLQTEKDAVQLHIPLPHVSISNTNTKNDNSVVTIEFLHLSKLNLVTARSLHKNHDSFLSGLFDGDDGTSLPAIIYHTLIPKDDDEECLAIVERMLTVQQHCDQNDQDNTRYGIPYQWCQMIAGLSTYSSPKTTSTSTMTLMTQILSCLRSQVTLQAFIHHFEKSSSSRTKGCSIPIHPSSGPLNKDKSLHTRVVTRWEELSSSAAKQMDIPPSFEKQSHQLQFYSATLQTKGKNSKPLVAYVAIHKVGYPAIPPLWNLVQGMSNNSNIDIVKPRFNWGQRFGSFTSLQKSTSPLADPVVAQLEARINVDFTQLIDPTVTDSFDWILTHQLHEIAQCWDQYTTKASEKNEESPEETMKKILQSREMQFN